MCERIYGSLKKNYHDLWRGESIRGQNNTKLIVFKSLRTLLDLSLMVYIVNLSKLLLLLGCYGDGLSSRY